MLKAENSNAIERFLAAIASFLLALFTTNLCFLIALRLFTLPGSILLWELSHYLFSALVLSSIALAFLKKRHVHLQLMSTESLAVNSRVSRFGWQFFGCVVPFLILFALSLPFVWTSWILLEGSREFGGLPGYFLIKSLLPIFCLGMAVIGCFQAYDSIRSKQ